MCTVTSFTGQKVMGASESVRYKCTEITGSCRDIAARTYYFNAHETGATVK